MMSSQLACQPLRDSPNVTQLSYPFLGPHTVVAGPLNPGPRSLKRLRSADGDTNYLETLSAAQGPRQELGRLQPLRIASTLTEQDVQQRRASASTTPVQRRSRRNGKQIPQDGNPFIIEAIPFPDQQPWLAVKPRRRKAGVDATKEPPSVSASALPEEGEVLSLDKDADRIAALITQKRRVNETSQFRLRMATQQRVHRGEPDKTGKVIAASSDELKRKLELSAKGIFEDKVPDGKEPEPELETEPLTPPTGPVQSLGDQMEIVDFDVVAPEEPASMQSPHSSQAEDVTVEVSPAIGGVDERDSAEDEVISRPRPATTQVVHGHEVLVPSASQSYLQNSHTAYYQRTVTTQMAVASNGIPTLPVAPPAQYVRSDMVYPQPISIDQQHSYTPTWYDVRPHVQQPWTHQMFQALPSTQTPVLEQSQITRDSEHGAQVMNGDQRPAYNVPITMRPPPPTQQRPAINLFSLNQPNDSRNSSSSPENMNESPNGPSNPPVSANMFSSLSSNLHPARFEPQPLVLHSNMNMFTRLARENGVIGGNNNLALAAAPRRNMFDSNR